MLAERSSSSVRMVARRTPIITRAGPASSPLSSRRLLSDGARGVGTTVSQRTRDNGEHSHARQSAGIVNGSSNNTLSSPFSASPSAFQVSSVRHASSSSSPHPSSSASATATRPPNPAAPASASTLTWNDFLQLRKTRRRYNLVASVTTGLGTAFTGAGYLATSDLNQLSNVLFGLDPFLAMGMSTVACGALGWLIGPIAGSGVFNMLHRKAAGEMLVKEKDFFHRIQKYRADISAGGNLQNTPFPDYYGEKIDSVAAYRQWLRDQRKFSRKREYRPT